MIDVEIEDEAWSVALPGSEAIVRQAAASVLTSVASFSINGGGESSLAILLADDAAIQDLNARFRGKHAPTNVLSFPAPATAAPHLGDIVLAYGVCAREAEEQGKPLAHHLSHLTAHGVLHLLGYDHDSDADAEVMEALERHILARLGVPDPYARDRPAPGPHAPDEADVPL